MRFSLCRRLCLLSLSLAVSLMSRALTIDNYAAAANDRFANDDSFIAGDFDLSGVALSNDARWVTLISPNVFLTAWHFTPAVGESVIFYQTNDTSGPSVTRTVSSVRQRIGSSDLNLCTLNLPVPEGYTYYAFATADLPTASNWRSYPYWNKELYQFGRIPENYTIPDDMRVGKNILDRKVDSQNITNTSGDVVATGPAIECEKDELFGNVTYETMAETGDSGAPLFHDNGNSTLTLAGISWYITSVPSTGFTPVGNYDAEINSFLVTHSSPYQPLAPETFTANRVSDTQINLSWTDVSAVETEYILERKEAADALWNQVAALSADSASYSDTAAPDGDVYYRLTAQNETASDPVTAAVLTPYSVWAEHFDWGDADQTPIGDANNDGIANLVAYSMNLSPIETVPEDARPSLVSSDENIDYFYRRNPDADDISYILKNCSNLLNPDWQSIIIDGTLITETNMGEADSADLIRIRMPASTVNSTGFFRLEINSSQLP